VVAVWLRGSLAGLGGCQPSTDNDHFLGVWGAYLDQFCPFFPAPGFGFPFICITRFISSYRKTHSAIGGFNRLFFKNLKNLGDERFAVFYKVAVNWK